MSRELFPVLTRLCSMLLSQKQTFRTAAMSQDQIQLEHHRAVLGTSGAQSRKFARRVNRGR